MSEWAHRGEERAQVWGSRGRVLSSSTYLVDHGSPVCTPVTLNFVCASVCVYIAEKGPTLTNSKVQKGHPPLTTFLLVVLSG